MRQSLAKGTRRELRRAVGVSALDALQDMERSIAILQTGLSTAHREIATLAVNHADFKRSSEQRMGLSHVSLAEFCGRPFRGRLRWLLTGK